MMTQQIGGLRCMAVIETPTRTKSNTGSTTKAWSNFADVAVGIKPLSGAELIRAQQTQAQVSHRVTMRWIAGVRADMRLVFDGRVLEIVSVINQEERNRWLTLMCKEKAT